MDCEDWSKALAKHWLNASSDREVVLALEPSILVDVARLAGVDFEREDDAVASLIGAVRKYQSMGNPWRAETPTRRGSPLFLILIAIQVLAASQMDNEAGKHTSRAYYVQLGKLVGERAMSANFAADHGEAHRALWRRLREWLALHNRTIHLPPDREGAHDRNVGLPKSQAVLRRADLAQLPVFFCHCRYRPGTGLSEERVKSDVYAHRYDAECFPSHWARRVLEDEHRFPTAVRQIFNELHKWDGQWELAAPASIIRDQLALSKCWFGISRRKSLLIAKVGDSLNSSTTISGVDLKSLISGGKFEGGHRLHLTDGLYTGRFDVDDCMYQQVSGFEPGDRGLIAIDTSDPKSYDLFNRLMECRDIVTNIEYYAKSAEFRGDSTPLTGIPEKCLFVSFEISDPLPHRYFIDRVWYRFLKSPNARLEPVGGLRFGRKRNWVHGAGPSIRIVGKDLPRSIEIDGQLVKVDQRLVSHPLLSEPGEHIVRASIDGVNCSPCRIVVSRPSEPELPTGPVSHWKLRSGIVPSWVPIDECDNGLIGMHCRWAKSDKPSEVQVTPVEERLAAIKALAGFPASTDQHRSKRLQHPLNKWLAENSAN